MKWLLHEPGLWLLLLCGGICKALRLKRAELWLRDQYAELEKRANET